MADAQSWTREKIAGLTKTKGDPHLTHNFTMEIMNRGVVGGIIEVKGLDDEHELVEYAEGEHKLTRVRPGRPKPVKFEVTREYVGDRAFVDWRNTVHAGNTERTTVTITLMNDAHEAVRQWTFFDAFPWGYTPPQLNSRSSANATETIKIVAESWKVD